MVESCNEEVETLRSDIKSALEEEEENINIYSQVYEMFNKSPKKVDDSLVVIIFTYNKSYIDVKPVNFPFKWSHICNKHAFMKQAEEFRNLQL